MANVFVNLPVPAGVGVGAWVDVSSQGPERLISVDGGAFDGQIYIEGSNDGEASAIPAGVGPFNGPTFAPQNFFAGWNFLRARRVASSGVGSPTVNLGAPPASQNVFGAMNVPTSDGVGTSIDLSGGGDINTFSVSGKVTGQILIETSTDGVNFSPTLLFTDGGGIPQTVNGVLSAARVRRRGSSPGVALPLVSVGSQATAAAGGGGGTVNSVVAGTAITITGPAANPVVNNAGVTSLVAGAGIAVSAAVGAVTVTNTGVTSAIAGTGLSVSAATGAVTFINTGVTFLVAGSGIAVSAATGAVTISAVGGAFPGFGGAPPAIAAASSAGASGLASESDHTHAGVGSIVAGTGITISGAVGAVTVNATATSFPGFGGAPPAVALASAAGASGLAAQSDHTHAAAVLNIAAGAGITATPVAGTWTIAATATSFPGFGGAPPAVASASAAGAAGTASHSDHTHAQDLSVVYAPSQAALQGAGVLQQTYAAPNATPNLFVPATGELVYGNTAGTGQLAQNANMFVRDSVVFGIGIQTPGGTLTAAAINRQLYLVAENGTNGGLRAVNVSATAAVGPQVDMIRARGTFAAQTTVLNQDVCGQLTVTPKTTAGASHSMGFVYVAQAITATDLTTLLFLTLDSVKNPVNNPNIAFSADGDVIFNRTPATTDTSGFYWAQAMPGVPTGVPLLNPAFGTLGVPSAASVPTTLDSTDRRFYAYVAGVWHYSQMMDYDPVNSGRVPFAGATPHTLTDAATFTFDGVNTLSVPIVSAQGGGALTLKTAAMSLVLDNGPTQAVISGSFLPSAAGTWDIGATGSEWTNVFASRVNGVGGGVGLELADAAAPSATMIFVSGSINVSAVAGGFNFTNTTPPIGLGTAQLAANGAVATVLGAVGPAGSHTTVQEWLLFKGSGGATRYVAGF